MTISDNEAFVSSLQLTDSLGHVARFADLQIVT